MTCSRLLLCGIAVTLAACGGGGGGGGAGAQPPPVGNQDPVAAFTATPGTGAAPLVVSFDASGADDPDGQIVSYLWNFDDGTLPAVGAQVSHTFTAIGDYLVELTVRDDDGATDTRVQQVRVTQAVGQFTLSGRVRILPSSAVDSDVNDVLVAPVSNNSFAEAQAIPNPVTLGGYVGDVGAGLDANGDPGALTAAGDHSDFFSISLTGNETLQLNVGDPANATLTLSLWTDEANPGLGNSAVVGGSGAGSIDATTPGDYFVEVSIQPDATNTDSTTYVLAIGQDLSGAATRSHTPQLADEFVPGELLVIGAARAPDLGVAEVAASGPVRRMSVPVSQPELMVARGTLHGGRVPAGLRRKLDTLVAAARLSRRTDVSVAEPNYIRRANLTPSDPLYGNQWHYPNINLPRAWDLTTGDGVQDPVIVAVVDTGILLEHPEFKFNNGANLVPGFDFISDPARARDGSGIDNNPNDPGDLAYGAGSSFHGTHVAGTVGAATNNDRGGAGVSWGAKIMPVRVLGVDGGTSYDVIQGVRWAAGLSSDAPQPPPDPADIINLSLGSKGSSQSEQQTINQVRAAGTIVIASAGNDASTLPTFPASYIGVVSVAATTITKTVAGYSNAGPYIDVAAPGGNLATDINGDGIGDGVISAGADDSTGTIQFGYLAFQGTSMAAPHVAGVAALMKAVHPGLTPEQFDTALAAGDLTEDRGLPGRDNVYGHGLIDAQKAVIAALNLANQGVPDDPIVVASQSSLNFGAFETAFDVEITNAGGGSVTITQVSDDQTWLSAAAANVDADGLGTYTISVNRAAVPDDGTYRGTVTFASTANSADVSVVMQKSSLNINADAGLHYIILVDADNPNGLPVAQDVRTAVNGEYPFTLSNVAAGQYLILAGSDMDNDLYIGDGGEAFGAYRTLDAPTVVSVNGNMTDLDFVSGFRINITSLGINTVDTSVERAAVKRLPVAVEEKPQ